MFLLMRAVTSVVVVVALLVGAGLMSKAEAAPQASIVMDMRDGKVLRARSADRRLHPASLTKMMTLYLTFEAIRDGRLRLDQKVRVSRHASRQPRSKLYLRAGQRVTVRSLIRAAAIKSANDAAMVLAEAVGGSERRFARMMTERAKRLGMRNSAFRNPHGLTRRGHYSTARDMAILARHLFFDFPEYYNIFKRRTERAAGKRIWTTNRLLATYPGADGIKTGYTRAAGYNLAASAHRGNKRILAVVFGARSSGQRARKVARLLDIGFARAQRDVRRAAPPDTRAASVRREGRIQVARSPVPAAKPGTRRRTVMEAVAEVLSSPAAAATPDYVVVTRASAAAAAIPPVGAPSASAPSKSRFAPRVADLPAPRAIRRNRLVRGPRLPENVPMPPRKPVRMAGR